jgi:hypothetical protein
MENYTPIKFSELPDIELYMDQVTSYLEKQLSSFKMKDDEKIMTKTMINNYVKAGILDKPIKKKYQQTHLAQLITLYFLKNVVSMDTINAFFTQIDSVEGCYDTFVSLQQEVLNTQGKMPEEHDEQMLYAMKLLLQADMNKRLAERIIEGM